LNYASSETAYELARQYFAAVLRVPYKAELFLKTCVAAVSAFHSAPPLGLRRIFANKADQLKPVLSTLCDRQ
jgi:hypothetical protein